MTSTKITQEISLAMEKAKADGCYLIVTGLPGAGCFRSTKQALLASNPLVEEYEFYPASLIGFGLGPTVKSAMDGDNRLTSHFASAASRKASILVDGFMEADEKMRKTIIAGLEKNIQMGLGAALVVVSGSADGSAGGTGDNLRGIDFGKAHVFNIAQPQSENKLSDSLKVRREAQEAKGAATAASKGPSSS